MKFNPKKHRSDRRIRPDEFEQNMRRSWFEGEYCPFHLAIHPDNKEKIKFVHGSTIDNAGDKVFYKSCPKCHKMFYYPRDQQISSPKVLIPNEHNN